jgi:hypothetical protein
VMRCRFGQFIVLAIAYSLSWQSPTHAQVAATISNTQASEACLLAPSSDHSQSSVPQLTIAELAFDGKLQMPPEEQNQLSASLKQQTFSGDVDEVVSGIVERVRAAWQNLGYFDVQAQADAKVLSSSPVSQRIAVSVRVDEGRQYRLEKITFRGNKDITNLQALRSQFPLKDGDVFDRAAVSQGLENLRFAYLQLGYLNFTSVPNTQFNDDVQTVLLEVSIDEGKMFYISSVKFLGWHERPSEALLKDLQLNPGKVYDQRLVDLFLEKTIPSVPSASRKSRVHQQLDERAGTVAITFDLRSCPAE